MASASKKIARRKSLSLKEKIEIINKIENGNSNHKLCKEYDVNSSTISTILKMKEKLKTYYADINAFGGNVKRKRANKPEYELLEKVVYDWLCQKRTIGEPVSGLILQEKARIFYSTLKLHEKISDQGHEFKASDGWLSRFKDRYNLRTLQPKGEKASADTVASENFVSEFNEFLEKNNYQLENIYNADETGLQYRSLPDKTLVLSNEEEVAGRKPMKERLTIMVCANATGSHRIPLLVIGKSAKPRCFKKNQQLPLNYTNQKKAWMNAQIFKHWFIDIFLKNVRELKPDAKIILLLDNAPTHPSAQELNLIDEKCTVIYLPPNVTSLIQPMDQGKWTVLDCMNVLREAWISLTPNTLRNSWKKLINPASLLNGMTLQSNTELTISNNELVNLVNRLPGGSVYSSGDVTNWLEKEDEVNLPLFKVISDEELLNRHADLNLPIPMENETPDSCNEDEELEETIDELATQPSILNAAQCIVNWTRGLSEFTEEERLIFIKARDLALNVTLNQAKNV
ncbi:jerky protein homolog-like isoform X2 [Leptopilina boulardi]|uniref:jerky protein homolog-like isoform X2 n=1 Tax=Leptopilina boulardi TaxID=63433 RepID=UPI0021F64655|nr:jerky protein homolog-like isoform X2 [Leptopilina boulardi]XP_051165602.1 jerky protein homolog-like isoform X2 [Leptopilina boulardi]